MPLDALGQDMNHLFHMQRATDAQLAEQSGSLDALEKLIEGCKRKLGQGGSLAPQELVELREFVRTLRRFVDNVYGGRVRDAEKQLKDSTQDPSS